jgi:hypothetical protein
MTSKGKTYIFFEQRYAVKSIAIFAVAAILATTVFMMTATQQALADRVGPNCAPGAPSVLVLKIT